MALSTNPCRVPHTRTLVGLLVILAQFSLVASAAQYGGGSGTIQDPYLIQTAQEFALIGDNPADWGKHFKLMKDIDLSGYNEKNLHLIGRWVGLGSTANEPFYGSFDGNGKTIVGFRYRDMQSDYVALFPLAGGEIRNLHVARATVSANGTGAAALVGRLEKGIVLDCSVTQADLSGNWGVGAIAGVADGIVQRCWSDGAIAGSQYVGGLIGQFSGGNIEYSYSKASVSGNESVGGLVGGSLGPFCLVDSCYATGPVAGGAYVGGLMGQLSAGKVSQCYSIGRVTGADPVGGLVGHKRSQGDVLGSVWDKQTSGQATSPGSVGRTTAQMKSIDTYLSENWSFAVWSICEGISYPILLWQIPLGDLRCPDGVNFTDFVRFSENWRRRNCGDLNYSCDGADLDKSGAVDPRDLALFAANWLAGIDL